MDRMTTRDISRRFTPSQALAFLESFRPRVDATATAVSRAPLGSPPTLHMKNTIVGQVCQTHLSRIGIISVSQG
ncbi:hypothetical protein JB92DRAFT_3269447 [Gautieria morchelliformis]|nr:hypothetical protein JB92DRAFT_3269447 [Gautieria morchelliformis]